MTANATHPGRITIPGTDVGVKGTLVAEPQTENMVLTLDDRLALGPVKVDTDPSGTLESPGLVVPIVASVLWLLRFEPHRHDVPPFVMGVYNLNTSGVDLKDLVETIPSAIDETTKLNIAAAVALGATNDTATASFVNNTASATRGALDTRYGTKGQHRITDAPFNAVGDGVTNAAPALNAAGVAAQASGLPVVLPYTSAGYIFTTTANTTLLAGVTYILENGVKVKMGGTSRSNLWNAVNGNITIQGGTFDGAGLASGSLIGPGDGTRIIGVTFMDSGLQPQAGYAISQGTTQTSTDVLIDRCTFLNLRNSIHGAGNPVDWTVSRCRFTGYSSTAIAVDGTASASSKNFRITDCTFVNHDATTIGVTNKAITGTTTATLTTVGTHPYLVGETIYVDITDAIYDGNHTLTAVTPTTLSWTRAATTNASTASAGYVSRGNRQPISFQGFDTAFHLRPTIARNTLVGNYSNHQSTTSGGTADMISLHRCEAFQVVDNIVEGSGDCGITISLQSHAGQVSNNVVRGSSNAGIAIGSATIAYVRDLKITGNTSMNNGQGGGGSWASTGINARKLTGGLIEGNYLGDDQAVPTQWYGITLGDTTGTSDQVHVGPNFYRGNTTGRRMTYAGNTNLTFADQPTTVTKASDQAMALNSATVQDVTGMVIPLEANAVYEVEYVAGYKTNGVGGATPGLIVGFAAITGATAVQTGDLPGTTASSAPTISNTSNRSFFTSLTTPLIAGGFTGAQAGRVVSKARVTTGTTAGNLQLQASQQTADAVNATTIVAGSYMKAVRVA